MKKQFDVIEVPKSGKPQWYGGAYTLAFVYSPKGNFLVKGYMREIEEYLDKRFGRYFVRYTMYKHRQHRDIFHFSNACGLYLGTPRLKHDGYCPRYIVRPFGAYKDITKTVLSFKRFPTKWIPEFDNLIDKYVKSGLYSKGY
jgi:hypothetical protein